MSTFFRQEVYVTEEELEKTYNYIKNMMDSKISQIQKSLVEMQQRLQQKEQTLYPDLKQQILDINTKITEVNSNVDNRFQEVNTKIDKINTSVNVVLEILELSNTTFFMLLFKKVTFWMYDELILQPANLQFMNFEFLKLLFSKFENDKSQFSKVQL